MTDILIVGGGIIGMLSARDFAQAGLKVTLLDKQATGSESSWAGGGIISPLYPWRYSDPVSQLARWSQQHYPALVESLYEETGLDPELEHSGLLILDNNEFEAASAWAAKWQSHLQLIDNKEINRIEPALPTPYPGSRKGIWLSEVAQVRNPRMVKSLYKSLVNQGVTIIENTEVKDFIVTNGKVAGARTASESYFADKVLIASGAWTGALLEKTGIQIDVGPVKGQMILFKAAKGTLKRIILSKDRYVIPRRDGRILVGSTLEQTDFDKSTTAEAKEELIAEAHRIVPALSGAELEHHWAGLRPSSPQGIPYISEHPEIEGLFINAGHFRNGVVLGPASARLIADLVLQRTPSVDPSFYQVK